MEVPNRAKTRLTSVENELRPRHETLCVESSSDKSHISRLHHWIKYSWTVPNL